MRSGFRYLAQGMAYGNFVGGLGMLLFGLLWTNPVLLVVGTLCFTSAVAAIRWR